MHLVGVAFLSDGVGLDPFEDLFGVAGLAAGVEDAQDVVPGVGGYRPQWICLNGQEAEAVDATRPAPPR